MENLVHTVSTETFEMDYVRFGSGPKNLVIVPGLSLKPITASAAFVEKAYRMFEEDYTVYLLDRRKDVPEDFSLQMMADDISATMDALHIQTADVFGTSQGGMISQLLAIEHPEKVRRLVLGSSTSRAKKLQLEVIGGWTAAAREGRTTDLVESFVDNAFSKAYLERFRRALLKMYSHISDAELDRFAKISSTCGLINTQDRLGEIKCPVLVIGASEDHVVTPEASLEIYNKLKSEGVPCELYMYEGYGHAVYDEAPDYKDRLLAFFRKG